jgi:uncharacterized membrane protein
MQEDRLPPNKGDSWVNKWPLTVLGLIVWIATAAFGLYAIYMGRQIVVRLVYLFTNDLPSGTLAGTVSVIVLALVWLWFVIVAGEVSMKRIHQRKGWTFLIGGAVVELLIWMIYIII